MFLSLVLQFSALPVMVAIPQLNHSLHVPLILIPLPPLVAFSHPPIGPYYNPRPRQRIPRDLAMCVTPSGQFYCSMCNCGAEQETDFRQHLESKQHKAKVSELRYRHEMENLGYS